MGTEAQQAAQGPLTWEWRMRLESSGGWTGWYDCRDEFEAQQMAATEGFQVRAVLVVDIRAKGDNGDHL